MLVDFTRVATGPQAQVGEDDADAAPVELHIAVDPAKVVAVTPSIHQAGVVILRIDGMRQGVLIRGNYDEIIAKLNGGSDEPQSESEL